MTPGNYDDWDRLNQRFASRPGEAIRLTDVVWVLPRGFRFTLAGRTFMSFGGAASLDYEYRRARGTWWPAEMPTGVEVVFAMEGSPVEVLVARETINGGTAKVEAVLRANPQGWEEAALEYSRASRHLITTLSAGVEPALLFRGHLNAADRMHTPSCRRIVSLLSGRQRKTLACLTSPPLRGRGSTKERQAMT